MKKFTDFCDHNDLYELKPGWVVRIPSWFTQPFGRAGFTAFAPVIIGAMVAGTTMQMAGTLKQGKEAEKIGKARAAIDIRNAEAARRASVERAKIKGERGRRLLATQKVIAAAGNIRINVGAPLVIEAQTRADIAKDVGFILEQGRETSGFYKSRAAIERAVGKAARRKSKWDAVSQGLMGFGSIAFMGSQAGWFNKTPVAGATGGVTADQLTGGMW